MPNTKMRKNASKTDTAGIGKNRKKGLVKMTAISRIIASNPSLDFLKALESAEEATLSYVAHKEAFWESELKRNVLESLNEHLSEGRLNSLSLRIHFNPIWETTADNASINIPLIKKDLRDLERSYPNAIVRLTISQAWDEGTGKPMCCPGLMLLGYGLEGDRKIVGGSRSRQKLPATVYRERPALEPMACSEPSPEHIAHFAECFLRAEAKLKKRAAAMVEGQEQAKAAWKASFPERARGSAQLGSMIRAEKAIFGFGNGQMIINKALLAPVLRAKAAKKDKSAADLDVVQNLHWKDAFSRSKKTGSCVPYVKQ